MKKLILILILAALSPFAARAMQKPSVIDERNPKTGDTALIEAARAGNLEMVKFLLASGADPELKNNAGEDAMSEARKNRRASDVYVLIRDTVNQKEYERTFAGYTHDERLLYSAILGDRIDEVRKLLAKGTNPNIAPGESKDSLLMVAAWHNDNPEIVLELLKAGAKAAYRNKSGKSALDKVNDILARENPEFVNVQRYMKIRNYLENYLGVPVTLVEKPTTVQKTVEPVKPSQPVAPSMTELPRSEQIVLDQLVLAKKTGRQLDYRRFSTQTLNELLTYIWPMLDPKNTKPISDFATRLGIDLHNMWIYVQAIKQELIQALLEGQLDTLIQAKNNRSAIDYGPSRYTVPNLQELHLKVVTMLDPRNQQSLLTAAQRLSIAPVHLWDYLQAIKNDLENAINQRR